MLIYYTFVIFMVILSMLIMLVATSADQILPSTSKRGYIVLFSTIIVLAIAEWLGVYIEYADIEIRLLSTVRVIIMFSIIPIAPMVVVSSIGEIRYEKAYKIVFVINFIMQVLSAKFGFIYYIDENCVYHRGDYYWIYIISYAVSTSLLFYSMYHLSRRYQNKNNIILLLLGIVLVVGITIQMIYPRVYSVWLSISVSSILLYIYFYSLIAQMDPLTSLLNRRCYENRLSYPKRDAIIIYFDVNKFKQVNDELGHLYGDYCLSTIGRLIRKKYSAYGNCYRVGGDEFCVILDSHLHLVDKLNTDFSTTVLEKQIKEPNLPGVSVGYGMYSKGDVDFTRAIDKADKMMYEEKRKRDTE